MLDSVLGIQCCSAKNNHLCQLFAALFDEHGWRARLLRLWRLWRLLWLCYRPLPTPRSSETLAAQPPLRPLWCDCWSCYRCCSC